MPSWTKTLPDLCLLALLGLVLVTAWHDIGTTVDDAYITFRFAENLQHGHGLRWNPGGPPCEGYSNLSYVVGIAALGALSVDPRVAALLLASASVLGMLVLHLGVARSARRLAPLVLVPAALLLGRPEVEVHASRGLETCAFALLCVAQVWAAARLVTRPGAGRGSAVLAAVCGVLLFVTRPDGVLMSACCWLVAAWYAWRDRGVRRPLVLAVLLWLAAGGLYALWKLWVFGYLLPNPFYMKNGGAGFQGVPETLAFVRAYAWSLLAFAVALVSSAVASWRSGAGAAERAQSDPAPYMALLIVACWIVYSSKIVHEIGFAHRFAWPAAAVAAFGAARGFASLRSVGGRWLPAFGALAFVGALAIAIPTVQGHVRKLSREPARETTTAMFLRLGDAIAATGIAEQLTLYCTHAGATPYAARARHIDPAGLCDNGYCLRTPPEQRAAYASKVLTEIDIVSWHLFPASPGATAFDQDARARGSRYLNEWVLGDDPTMDAALRTSFARADLEQRRVSTFGYMAILRDFATFVGEMRQERRRFRTFVYVWKASPHHDRLVAHLREHVDIPAEAVDFDDWPR